MFNRTKAAGVLFLAVSSVYTLQALAAKPPGAVTPSGGSGTTNVKVLAASEDPFSDGPVSQPLLDDANSQGTSVTADAVNVNDEGSVEIHVNDASLVEVLRMMSIQAQRNIVASKEVGGKVTANLYGVTVREALDAILHANGYAYREKGNFIYVYTAKEIAEMEKAERVTTTEVFRLFYTPAANAANMIKPVLSDAAQVSLNQPSNSGIATGTDDTGGSSHATEDVLVVTDYSENLERVRKVLKEIDRRPQQILIEATILRAALTEDNALGVDFNVLAGVSFQNVLLNNGGQVTGGNTGANTAPVNNGVGGVGTGNSFTSGVPGGLKLGFVSDNVSVFLSALEGVTDTVVLANPKVLALNKQKGEVIVGRKDGYLTTTVTESSTVQTVEFLDTGTRLIFRPFIGDEGNIRMEIHPEDSSGGLTADNLPFKITTEVTSNVMVKDGRTIVIGGLFREATDSSKSQVPGLGNLPVAGYLFRNQRDRTTREEIIILLTPHIIKDDKAFSDASEQELNELDKLRVGVRRGMMPFGRERLAESAYEKASNEMNKDVPDREKALFFLNCATNLNPKFTEARALQERITGRQLSASDNSSVRSFIRRQILAEKDMPVPTTLPSSVPITVTPRSDSTRTMPASQSQVLPASDSPATQPSTQPTKLLVGLETSRVFEDSNSSFSTSATTPAAPPTIDWSSWLKSATDSAVAQKGVEQSPTTQPTIVQVDPAEHPIEPPHNTTSFTELPMEPVVPLTSGEPK
ncbi:MAG TPA: secretin and TonB N-terminal domain-containing protein [Tepidisphaeraceae bacterium]|nr:secretin and TonB N-terminal domain-containing protein [Tepidisphaeraceae bacterium]